MPLPKSTHPELPLVLRLAGLWLIYVSWCQATGWVLSALGHLHTTGYLATAPVLLGLALWFWSATRPAVPTRLSCSKWLRRIKTSPSLAAWSVVTLLILLGALINPPSNYDGLTYRLPKLLYWLQESRWHWIDGLDFRLNITGAGFEWLCAPFILFTRSDRGLFLLNFLPFLLLPGLFFVAARGLGIRTRVARWWMWVWPMAYGIAMQAGSIGNDMAAAALALAALAFAAQALRGHPCLCLFLSALAAAAMTGIKATTLPLGLPLGIYWLWVACKTLGWRKTSALGAAVLPLAILLSFLPIAIACSIHTGKWNGNPGNRHGAEPQNPVAGVIGNAIEFGTGLIEAPVLPASAAVNAALLHRFDDHSWYLWAKANYACFDISTWKELPSEEVSGIGLGITCVMLAWTLRRPAKRIALSPPFLSVARWFLFATSIATLAFMAKSGIGGTARLMVPFTPFLLLSLLIGFGGRPLPRRLLGPLLQILPAAFLIPALLLNPNRPLLPVATLLALPGVPPSMKNRMTDVYETYQRRGEILSPFLTLVPESQIIGFAGGGDHSALGLFKPFGTGRVLNLSPRTESHLNWIVATSEGLERRMEMSQQAWESQNTFEKVTEMDIVSRVSDGPETWFLYRRVQPKP